MLRTPAAKASMNCGASRVTLGPADFRPSNGVPWGPIYWCLAMIDMQARLERLRAGMFTDQGSRHGFSKERAFFEACGASRNAGLGDRTYDFCRSRWRVEIIMVLEMPNIAAPKSQIDARSMAAHISRLHPASAARAAGCSQSTPAQSGSICPLKEQLSLAEAEAGNGKSARPARTGSRFWRPGRTPWRAR
jgi:hypothetical protein